VPIALIPYFSVPTLELGPLVLDSWAALVAIGFLVGMEVVRARGLRKGIEPRDTIDGIVVTVGLGFVVGHIVHVLAYNPHQLEEQGIVALLRVWAGFSSTGGFIGAVLGAMLFYLVIRKRPFWRHADTIMFGFPVAWFFGRMGCFTAHDHVGALSNFALAVDFPVARYGGPRHDLGLYEALWTLGIAIVFYLYRNKPVRDGFFTALFCLLYAPARFGLDFLRNTDLEGRADARWLGLTPAQYGMILMFIAGVLLVPKLRRGGLAPGATPPPDGKSSEP